MKTKSLVLIIAGIAALAAYFARKASAATPERIGTATIEPVQQVGAIGNTTAPIESRPGDGTYDAALIPAARDLCACAPLNSFGAACKDVTWQAVPLPLGGEMRIELRSILPTVCSYGGLH